MTEREALIEALEVLSDVTTQMEVWTEHMRFAANAGVIVARIQMLDRAADLRTRCESIRTLLERTERP